MDSPKAPGVYTVDLRKPCGEVLSLTHRADSDRDAHDKALSRAINDGWFAGDHLRLA